MSICLADLPYDILRHHLFVHLSHTSVKTCVFVCSKFWRILCHASFGDAAGQKHTRNKQLLDLCKEADMNILEWLSNYLKYPVFEISQPELLLVIAKGSTLIAPVYSRNSSHLIRSIHSFSMRITLSLVHVRCRRAG